MPEEPLSTGRVTLAPSWRIAGLVVAGVCSVVVIETVFVAASRVIGWSVAAAVVALLLQPVAERLGGRIPRVLAIILTFLFVGVLGAGLAWLYTTSVLDEVSELRDAAPELALEIEARDDRLGTIARDINLNERVVELTDRLEERSGSTGEAVRTAALSAPAYLVSGVLAIFFLVFGGSLVSGAIGLLRPSSQASVRQAVDSAARRWQGYVWAAIAQAGANGAAIFVAGTLLDVPAIGVLALLGALVSMAPYLGVAVGWLPVILLSIETAGVPQAIALVGLAAGLQVVEMTWWRRRVDRLTLHLGPAIPLIAAVLGYSVYGIGGAIYGAAITVFAVALLDELSTDAAPIPTPLDRPDEALPR